jgi:hypothetical protein
MSTISFRVDQRARDHLSLPLEEYASGEYAVNVDVDGNVVISGNSEGLRFLAHAIVACAVGDLSDGFHLHLPLRGAAGSPSTGQSPELTVLSAGAGPITA